MSPKNITGLGNNRGLKLVQTLSDWVLSPETTNQKPFSRTAILAGTLISDKSTLVTTAGAG
jgi:hypothetical protein